MGVFGRYLHHKNNKKYKKTIVFKHKFFLIFEENSKRIKKKLPQTLAFNISVCVGLLLRIKTIEIKRNKKGKKDKFEM